MNSLPPPATAPGPARIPARPANFKLVQQDRHTTVVNIDQWTISATKRPILNIKEVDSAEKSLGLPLPEMTFGNNSLILTYSPTSTSTTTSTSTFTPDSASSGSMTAPIKEEEVRLSFNALDALSEVAVGEGWEERVGGGVRVAMAEHWGQNRSNPSALLTDVPLPTTPIKPHDWTYSGTYAGSISGPGKFIPSTTHQIPMALLARQDPILDQILFYEDVPLFEDELHDNGESILNARIRIMPHSLFVLARLFLRVDNVLFRMFDVRIYHAFGSGEIIREVTGMEAKYTHVKAMLEKPSDLSPLTDANFVHRAMTHLSSRPAGDRDVEKAGKAWPGLGKRVEIMKLPGGGKSALDQAEAGIRDMGIS